MLEAVLWERACSVRKGRQWKTVVDEMISNFDKTWPTILCTIDQAATVAVSLTPEALTKRFQRLQSKKTRADGLRSKALKVIAQTQLYAPPLGTPLWNYFRPAENTIISKGSLAQKEKALENGRKAKRQQQEKSRLPSRKGGHGAGQRARQLRPQTRILRTPLAPRALPRRQLPRPLPFQLLPASYAVGKAVEVEVVLCSMQPNWSSEICWWRTASRPKTSPRR